MMTALLRQPRTLLHRRERSEVLALGSGHVLKLFDRRMPVERIERELAMSQLAADAGWSVPRVESGVVRNSDGRLGIVFERLQGTSLSDAWGGPRRMFSSAATLAEIHRRIHDWTPVPGMPSQRAYLSQVITTCSRLSPSCRMAAMQVLDSLPDGDRVCHGAFQPSHVITDGQRFGVLHWRDLTLGNPWCDVASTTLRMDLAYSSKGEAGWIKALIGRLRQRSYQKRYRQQNEPEPAQWRGWLLVNAVERLAGAHVPAVAKALQRLIDQELCVLAAGGQSTSGQKVWHGHDPLEQ